jgi:hypothetical protein
VYDLARWEELKRFKEEDEEEPGQAEGRSSYEVGLANGLAVGDMMVGEVKVSDAPGEGVLTSSWIGDGALSDATDMLFRYAADGLDVFASSSTVV